MSGVSGTDSQYELFFLIWKLNFQIRELEKGFYYFQPKDSWLISYPVKLNSTDRNEKRTLGEDDTVQS